MELKDAIEKRTSVRSFLPDEVPADDIREMVRRAGLAPSVNNFQPWSFILITNKDLLKKMATIISEKYREFPFKESDVTSNVKKQVEWYSTFFTSAPALIAVLLEKYESVLERGSTVSHEEINRLRNYPDIQGTGACIQNILLTAVEMGYGGCWLSGPLVAGAELEKLIGVTGDTRLLSFIAIGKPSKDFTPKTKENLGEKLKILS